MEFWQGICEFGVAAGSLLCVILMFVCGLGLLAAFALMFAFGFCGFLDSIRYYYLRFKHGKEEEEERKG